MRPYPYVAEDRATQGCDPSAVTSGKAYADQSPKQVNTRLGDLALGAFTAMSLTIANTPDDYLAHEQEPLAYRVGYSNRL